MPVASMERRTTASAGTRAKSQSRKLAKPAWSLGNLDVGQRRESSVSTAATKASLAMSTPQKAEGGLTSLGGMCFMTGGVIAPHRRPAKKTAPPVLTHGYAGCRPGIPSELTEP